MNLFGLFRREADGTQQQTAIGQEIARSLVKRITGQGPSAARRLAASAAVFGAVAERIDRPDNYFDPFFRAFWGTFPATAQPFGTPEELFGLVERATPTIVRGIDAVEPADQLRFGQELVSFIDPSLDSRDISVSAGLSIEFGHEIVAAAKLLEGLAAPRPS